MSSTKHTPGPWVYHTATESIRADVMQLVVNMPDGPSMTSEAYATKQANARLIASAPTLLEQNTELLEALKVAQEVLTTIYAGQYGYTGPFAPISDEEKIWARGLWLNSAKGKRFAAIIAKCEAQVA